MVSNDSDIPEAVIVTVSDESGSFVSDFALPSLLSIGEMRVKLMEILKMLDSEIFYGWSGCRLRCGNRVMPDVDTLIDAGVFDGGRIVVMKE